MNDPGGASTPPLPPPAGADRPAETRTFLIADIRGYTTYTVEHGDEAAAELAARFAGLVREVVEAREGFLIELRGDEALVAFVSARQALRAALELQARFAAAELPRGVGIGLDSGEAIPVGDGYRGGALNLAARLCAQAKAGQIIASEGVIHLAARVDGIAYVEARTLRLKGYDAPVRAVDVVSAAGAGTRQTRRRGAGRGMDRRLLAAGIAGLVVVILLAVALPGAFAPGAGSTQSPSGPVSGFAASPLSGIAGSPTSTPTVHPTVPASATVMASPSAASSPSGPASPSAATATDVAMFKGGLGRTNVMPGPAPRGELRVGWQFRAAADIATSPVVADGKVFAGGRDGIVHVVDLATGGEDWSFATGSAINASTAVAQDTLYVTSSDGVFHAVDISTHQERWRVTGVSPGAVPTVDGDTAYLGLAAGRFAAVSTADGSELWHVDVSGDASKNAIADGTAYVDGEGSDSVYAIDLASGSIRWQTRIRTDRVITPAVADGTVYVVGIDPAGKDSHLAALDSATGALRWIFAPPTRASLSTLAVGPALVFTSSDSPTGTSLFAVDRQSGKVSWSVSLADGPIPHPAIAGNLLFVASGTGVLHELDAANGGEISHVDIGGPAIGGPIVTGGLVLVGTDAGPSAPGSIWAIGSDPEATAPGPPIPVKWLTDLKAPDDKPSLYLNVAVDSAGRIYATDRFSDRIVIWSAAGKPTIWGGHGRGPGQFDFSEVTLGDQSMSVGIAPDGRIAVGDGGNHRVQIFDAQRRFLQAIMRDGAGQNLFVNPCCVAFDPQGRLYVADPGRDDIQVFARDGKLLRVIGSRGSGNGQFLRLGVPYIDPATGNIWVPDFGNSRVEVIAPSGTFLTSYGDGQNGNPQLAQVNGVVLDKAARMFVVDTNNFLWVLDPTGRELWRLGPDLPGAGYVVPSYLLLTGDGKVYLPDTDPGNNRVVVLQLQAPLWPPP